MDFVTILIILLGILFLILMAIYLINRSNKSKDTPFDNMEGEEFEVYCKKLLELRGFQDVRLTPGSHDYGIDIFAEKDGIKYAIQCKCYNDTVGIKAVQEAYSGKAFYDCMVGVVMTNQAISSPAKEFAEKLNVLLWDGDYIERLARNSM